MKNWPLVLLFLFLIKTSNSQNFYTAYQDGSVYAKFSSSALKTILYENPRNIPLYKLEFLNKLGSTYGISKICRPFSNANDDPELPFILRIEFSKKELVESLIKDLQNMPSNKYAEKIPLAKIDVAPNDPLFLTPGGGNHLNQINAQNAWNVSTGNPTITVAIIDNAVMWTHADLIANTYTNTGEIANNGIDDDGNGYVDDRNGFDVADFDNNAVPTNTNMSHGTHCAGIAAATTNNNLGVSGIGWNIKFIPVKCETNNGNTSSVTYGYEGIIYAVKAKAKVISISWTNSPNVSSFTEQSVINYAWNRGCILVACAGNFATNTPYFPAAYNNVYSVAAVDNANVKAPYSNFGSWVDIAAPGTTIQSTVPYLGTPLYQSLSGTSMSTPLVAGLAGLILSYAPNMTRTNVLNCISSSATNIYTLSGNSAFASGNQLGAGRIDAYNALLCAANYTSIAPQANFFAFPKNTCPNTPITFYDSSNYVPTSWNWSFQGGTPATSTSSNPSVQWLSPGSYSVSLTVSNGSGNNSITKLAYITIAAPTSSNLPYTEGFEGLSFLPTGWSENNIQNDQIFWQRKTNLGGFGTSTACVMFDNSAFVVSGDRDEIRSPRFDLTNILQARLRFDVAYARYNATFSDSLEIKISTNCGLTWTSIYLKGGTNLSTSPDFQNGTFFPNASQWRKDSIDISTIASGQGNVMFSFINRGHFGQALYLDNINLFIPGPNLNVANSNIICTNLPITFTNNSVGSNSYTWNFQGGTPSVSTINNPTVTYQNAGTYTFSLIGNNGNVQGVLQKTLSVFTPSNIITNFNIINATCSTCTNGSINLTTSGGAGSYVYLWSPLVSNTNTANNLNPGCYTIQTTDLSGCISSTVACVSFPDGLDLHEFYFSQIKIYPNPTNHTLFIENVILPFDLKLFNSLGQICFDEKNIINSKQINMSQYPQGIYYIEININHQKNRKKIILN
jgi:subtilisin family serine protease